MANGRASADHLRTIPFWPGSRERDGATIDLSRFGMTEACLAMRLSGDEAEQNAAYRAMTHAAVACEAFCLGHKARFHQAVEKFQAELQKEFERGRRVQSMDEILFRNDQAKKRKSAACFVYFVQAGGGEIKIGSALDVQRRVNGLQTSHPHRLVLLATTTGGAPAEAAYHARFTKHRLHGEWFAPHADILAEIERLNAS